MIIRKAQHSDIKQILNLLKQVLEIHTEIRPDIFVMGSTKYTDEQLQEMIDDDKHHIYVAVDNNNLLAYAFCEIKSPAFTNTMKPMKMFYIDDFCVDETCRRQHIGEALFEYLKDEAKKFGCYEITLASWEGNDSARKFYEKMGLKPKMVTMEYILK